jgi:pimeloyl-ACP methyl ester carboxylesterase
LHAFPLGGRMWAHQQAALEAGGWTTAAPDLSGPDASPTYRETAERLLRTYEGDLIPVGASMGGHLTFELWRQAPERFPALVLTDTRATPDTPEQRQSRDRLIAVLEERGTDGLAETMAGMGEPGLSMLREQPAGGLVATLRSMRDRPDSTDTLAGIDVPVLVLTGAEDRVVPPELARGLVEALADARYAEIAGAGHVPAVEQPEAFTRELVAFLDGLPAA